MRSENKKVAIITSLYRGERYLRQFFNHLNLIKKAEEYELILVHNEPTEREKTIIAEVAISLKMKLVHLQIPREGLYASWNRGISAAHSEYVTIWNIDDVRFPGSIAEQAACLGGNLNVDMCIGNYIVVNEYGKTEGKLITVPEFEGKYKHSFIKRHHGGSFIMWRKSIHDKVGYFDEQFRLVGDLDFQIRVAKLLKIKKVDKILGYFLAGTPENLSSNYQLQDKENTAIHLRYGNYGLINIPNIIAAKTKINISEYHWLCTIVKVNRYFDAPKIRISNLLSLFIPFYKMPRHFARKYLKRQA